MEEEQERLEEITAVWYNRHRATQNQYERGMDDEGIQGKPGFASAQRSPVGWNEGKIPPAHYATGE